MFDRTLVLETSGKVGQIGLVSGDRAIAQARLDEQHRRASDLALVVERLLHEQGWSIRDLSAVVVGLGPGSYTGLRVGLASAKALAYAVGCGFVGVETFAAIVAGIDPPIDHVVIVADALQGKLYCAEFRRAADWQSVDPTRIVAAEEWAGSMLPGCAIAGPAASQIRTDNATLNVALTPRMLVAAAQRFPWAIHSDMWTAEPLYLRGSSAEEKKPL